MKNIYQEYCTGCGLCQSEKNVTLKKDEKGFRYPEGSVSREEIATFYSQVCPASGKALEQQDSKEMWGRHIEAYAAYSKDEGIRKKASSGGVLTSLAIFLLEEGYVDGIIHVGKTTDTPYATQCYCSTTKEEVVQRCGSRYAISAPLMQLSKLVQSGKQYCVIAKPCDVIALRNFMSIDDKYQASIKYIFSFFCAGMPSDKANRRLLQELGCAEKECVSLNYRGDGWPGFASAVDKQGKKYQMGYSESWGGILGRDINKYCRFCMDGIGEMADLACGDGWYVNQDNQPDFSEKEGRNVVFARTQLGNTIFQEAVQKGYLHSEKWENIEILKSIQKYQYTRKSTMRAKILAFKLLGKPVPKYSAKILKEYARNADAKQQAKIFLGSVKRIVQKKI